MRLGGDYRSCGAVHLCWWSLNIECVSSVVDTSSSVCDALNDERVDDGDRFITDVASEVMVTMGLVDPVAVEGGREGRGRREDPEAMTEMTK